MSVLCLNSHFWSIFALGPTQLLALMPDERHRNFNTPALRARLARLVAVAPAAETRAFPVGIGIFIPGRSYLQRRRFRSRQSLSVYYFFFNFHVLADVSPPSTYTSNTIVSVVAETFILRRISVNPAPPVTGDLSSL